MGNAMKNPFDVEVLLNNKPIDKEAGSDVHNHLLHYLHDGLYEIVNLRTASEGILELLPKSTGAEFYTFTFGN